MHLFLLGCAVNISDLCIHSTDLLCGIMFNPSIDVAIAELVNFVWKADRVSGIHHSWLGYSINIRDVWIYPIELSYGITFQPQCRRRHRGAGWNHIASRPGLRDAPF